MILKAVLFLIWSFFEGILNLFIIYKAANYKRVYCFVERCVKIENVIKNYIKERDI